MTEARLIAECSLCGHKYAHLLDPAELDEHMVDVHGMPFALRVTLSHG